MLPGFLKFSLIVNQWKIFISAMEIQNAQYHMSIKLESFAKSIEGCELEIQWNNLGFHNFQIVYFGFHALCYFIAVRCPMVFIGLRLSIKCI